MNRNIIFIILLLFVPIVEADSFTIDKKLQCYGSVQLNIRPHGNVSYVMEKCDYEDKYWYCQCNTDLNLTTLESASFNILYSYYIKPFVYYNESKGISKSIADINNSNNKRTKSVQLITTITETSSTYTIKEMTSKILFIGSIVFLIFAICFAAGIWWYFDNKKYEDITDYHVNKFLETVNKEKERKPLPRGK